MVHQKAILDLALQFDNACTTKEDLRKAYEKYNHIPQKSRALIDTFLKEGGSSSQTHEIGDVYLTAEELHQQHLDEEDLKETLKEQTMDENVRKKKIRKKQADDDEYFMKFKMDSNFTNENDPWEYSLDIDDYDLYLTHILRSSSSAHVEPSPYTPNPVTIIPGHTGVVQLSNSICVEPSSSTPNPVRIIPGPAGLKVVEDVGEDADFNSGAWVSATNYVNAFGGTVTGYLNVTLKDLSGTVPGTIHYKVFDVSSYEKDITVGAAMILANVSVFTPKPSKHYLNITKRNVVEVFRKDTCNFRTLITPTGNEADLVVPLDFIRATSEQFANTAYGFFLEKQVAYPVVTNYVRNTLSKYGLVKSMLNSSNGLFFFHFSFKDGMDAMLENGPCFIRNNPFILKKWNPDVNLLKEDVGNIPVWVKLHGVPMTAFSEDSLSVIATRLGTPLMLDSYTFEMCMQSWGRSSYASAMIQFWANYEWKPPRCSSCKIFGHVLDECPKNLSSDVAKKLKNPRQAARGVSIGHKVGLKPVKQVYRQVLKNITNTSGKKKQDVVPIQEVSNSKLFNALNSDENDDDLDTSGGNSKLVGKGSLNVALGSSSNTLIIDKIDKLERQIFDVEVVFDETANLMASTSFDGESDRGYGTNSQLEKLRETKWDDDYDSYDDDLYESHDMSDHL
ncbi:transposase, MuDR, MULE transposase domain protein [Tanacetum coccineum]